MGKKNPLLFQKLFVFLGSGEGRFTPNHKTLVVCESTDLITQAWEV